MASGKELRLEYAVVYGFGDFAFDMLRYDHCFPAAEEQSPLLREHYSGNRFVIVARYTKQPGQWTPDRWKSFCWKLCETFSYYEEARDYVKREIEKLVKKELEALNP